MEPKELIAKAVEARKLSYSPYSHFAVGAAPALIAVFRGYPAVAVIESLPQVPALADIYDLIIADPEIDPGLGGQVQPEAAEGPGAEGVQGQTPGVVIVLLRIEFTYPAVLTLGSYEPCRGEGIASEV